jgi:two-component system chemotaxis sensor kinase CheA
VVIEVSDDGQGMDPQRIAAAAIERGVTSAERIAQVSEEEVLELVCHPGFSLKKEVTTVSGRGVGMGIVKQQVELLRGLLKITYRLGQGATFRLQVPAKIALMPAYWSGWAARSMPFLWLPCGRSSGWTCTTLNGTASTGHSPK